MYRYCVFERCPTIAYVRFIRSLLLVVAVAAALWVVSARPWALGAIPSPAPPTAPEFTHSGEQDWINSPPLTLESLEGQVVLIDFWTYGCWNCRRSLPVIKALKSRFGDQGLRVVGVHTPEFKHERSRARLKARVDELGIEHPVMVDNDFSYWDAMSNRYWPTFYLIDKSGRVRERMVGEIRPGDDRAENLEAKIRLLLSETV